MSDILLLNKFSFWFGLSAVPSTLSQVSWSFANFIQSMTWSIWWCIKHFSANVFKLHKLEISRRKKYPWQVLSTFLMQISKNRQKLPLKVENLITFCIPSVLWWIVTWIFWWFQINARKLQFFITNVQKITLYLHVKQVVARVCLLYN